jgi:hypothetical protein
MTSEVLFEGEHLLFRRLHLAGSQGEREKEEIRVHVIALNDWTRARETEGILVDPKVWSGLRLAEIAGALP